jgi:hypothetical protein
MTSDPDLRDKLDAVLSQLPRPAVPTDLATRIVAHATARPQQMPRANLVAAVPDRRAAPSRRDIAARLRIKAGVAMALAASFALVFTHLPSETSSPGVAAPEVPQLARIATKPAAEQKAMAEPVFARADTPRPVPKLQTARQHRAEPSHVAPIIAAKMKDEEPLLPRQDAEPQSNEAALPQLLAQNIVMPDAPKRPVQGPPVPDDFRYAPGESGTVAGFGVVGRGAASGRAMGGSAASGSPGLARH